MTTQETDHIRFAGHEWDIVEWVGESTNAVPTSQALGFATQMESTANYRGRVDTLEVRTDDQLMLASMRVCLTDELRDAGFVPQGARAEPLDGLLAGQSVRFVFDHLPLPFTGELVIGRDPSGPPEPGQPLLDAYAVRARLRFEGGKLVDQQTDEAPASADGDGGFV